MWGSAAMPNGMATGSTAAAVDTMQVNADLSHISHDRDLTMKIMKKRQEEMTRRTRLLDPRRRQFGVDHSVLDAQVKEKRQLRDAEVVEDACYAQHLVAQEQVLQTVEAMRQVAQRERQKATINHSLTELTKEQRREYSLSDPKQYTSSFLTHPPEQLGPSSMSKFQGESIDLEKKKRTQQESAQWLKQQMKEKQDRERADRDWHRHHDDRMLEANALRAHCEAATAQEMREDKLLEAQENQELADKRRQRDQARKQREHDLTQQHTQNVLNDPRMNESHDNVLSYHGKKLDQKRLTLEEEQDVYNTNAHQIRHKQLMKKREAEEEADHHRLNQMGVDVRSAIEHRQAEGQKSRNRSCIEENMRIADAKRANDVKERRAHKSFDYEP